ncbi:hypothetical protein BD309DRAFT_971615 [Dichomitus squalens]|nr:hypothetical protein BD309DRAFT_971615 [Dichomitus squalens]
MLFGPPSYAARVAADCNGKRGSSISSRNLGCKAERVNSSTSNNDKRPDGHVDNRWNTSPARAGDCDAIWKLSEGTECARKHCCHRLAAFIAYSKRTGAEAEDIAEPLEISFRVFPVV